jgi:hypothetical protein
MIPPAYGAWQAGMINTTNRFLGIELLGSLNVYKFELRAP